MTINTRSENVGGLLVTYNPVINSFKEVLDSVTKQVSILIIIDNGSANIDDLIHLCSNPSVRVIRNQNNFGIAKAMNLGVAELKKVSKVEWVLLLDHDTILQDGYVSILIDKLSLSPFRPEQIWIVRGIEHYVGKSATKERNFVSKKINGAILSGSLVRMEALNNIAFREEFLIDFVDADFYREIRKSKHLAVCFNNVFMTHSLGKTIDFKGRPTTYHDSSRVYLATRNGTVLILEGDIDFRLLWSMIVSVFPTIYVEGVNRAVSRFLKGIWDGLMMRIHNKNFRQVEI